MHKSDEQLPTEFPAQPDYEIRVKQSKREGFVTVQIVERDKEGKILNIWEQDRLSKGARDGSSGWGVHSSAAADAATKMMRFLFRPY